MLDRLPPPPTSRTTVSVHLTHGALRAVRRGHPWVFDSGVRDAGAGDPGDVAVLYGPDDRFAGIGLWDPDSPLRVRVLQAGHGVDVGPDLFGARLDAALALRQPLVADPCTTGFRRAHGPNDGVPGLVVDQYNRTLVVKLYSAIWCPWLRAALEHLAAGSDVDRIVFRSARACADAFAAMGLSDGDVVYGSPLDGPVRFQESGVWFDAEPVIGQKTGFFLDQRDNRRRVEALAAGRATLNVFSYTGGFSLYAARGGAPEVVSVDISGPASAAAERNFAHNAGDDAIADARHEAVTGDAFDVLEAYGRAGRRFGLVVIDPPAFAKRAAETDRALAAYARLTRLGLAVLERDGRIVLASCSSRVSAEQFVANAQRAAQQAGRPLEITEQTGHALDHPVRFDEAAYLKCVFARA